MQPFTTADLSTDWHFLLLDRSRSRYTLTEKIRYFQYILSSTVSTAGECTIRHCTGTDLIHALGSVCGYYLRYNSYWQIDFDGLYQRQASLYEADQLFVYFFIGTRCYASTFPIILTKARISRILHEAYKKLPAERPLWSHSTGYEVFQLNGGYIYLFQNLLRWISIQRIWLYQLARRWSL